MAWLLSESIGFGGYLWFSHLLWCLCSPSCSFVVFAGSNSSDSMIVRMIAQAPTINARNGLAWQGNQCDVPTDKCLHFFDAQVATSSATPITFAGDGDASGHISVNFQGATEVLRPRRACTFGCRVSSSRKIRVRGLDCSSFYCSDHFLGLGGIVL